MNRQFRKYIAAAIVGLCPASFGIWLWLFFKYFSYRPKEPHPEVGLIYPLSNHGSYVYISDQESTGLALLIIAFFVGFLLTFTLVPKTLIPLPPGTPRWRVYLGAAFTTDLRDLTKQLFVIVLCSIIFWSVIILFVGSILANFLIFHGIILHF